MCFKKKPEIFSYLNTTNINGFCLTLIPCLRQSDNWTCGFHSLKNALLSLKFIFDTEFNLKEYFEKIKDHGFYKECLEKWREPIEDSKIDIMNKGINSAEHKILLNAIKVLGIDQSYADIDFKFNEYIDYICSLNGIDIKSENSGMMLYDNWLAEIPHLLWEDGELTTFKLFSLIEDFLAKKIPAIAIPIGNQNSVIPHFITVIFKNIDIEPGFEIFVLDSLGNINEETVNNLLEFILHLNKAYEQLFEYIHSDILKLHEWCCDNTINTDKEVLISSNIKRLVLYIELLKRISDRIKNGVIEIDIYTSVLIIDEIYYKLISLKKSSYVLEGKNLTDNYKHSDNIMEYIRETLGKNIQELKELFNISTNIPNNQELNRDFIPDISTNATNVEEEIIRRVIQASLQQDSPAESY